jgi:uncharacterized delta-60 repeat protein
VKGGLGGIVLVLAVSALGLLPAAAMADGQLDPSFGEGGRVVLSHAQSAGAEGAASVLPLGDGRVISAGMGQGNGVWVTQSLAGGGLDPAFGEAGSRYFMPPSYSFVSGAVREPDGAIVVVGGNQPTSSGEFDTLVSRLTPQGELDPSFGNDAPHPAGDGLDLFDFGGEDVGNDLALDSTGKIVVVGRVGPSNDFDVLLARLDADGSIDPGFGGPTGVHTDLGASAEGLAVAAQGDRMIVLASIANSGGGAPGVVKGTSGLGGTEGGGTFVLAYRSDGSLDPSFGGGDGIIPVALPGGLEGGALLVEPNGDVVVAGGGGEQVQIERLLPDGTPDPGFGSAGVATFSAAAGKQLYAGSLARMDDGRIIAAGASDAGKAEESTILIRTLPNGQPDPAWGEGGVLTVQHANGVEEGAATVAVEPNRRILVGGEWFNGEDDSRVLLRLLGDTTPPDTAITKTPPAKKRAPLNGSFAFTAVGDVNTTFECRLTRPPAKPRHKRKRHKPRRHKKPSDAKAHSEAGRPASSFAPCSPPVVYPKLRVPGGYHFAVRSTDPAGNVDPTPAEAAFRVLVKPHKKHRRHHKRAHKKSGQRRA